MGICAYGAKDSRKSTPGNSIMQGKNISSMVTLPNVNPYQQNAQTKVIPTVNNEINVKKRVKHKPTPLQINSLNNPNIDISRHNYQKDSRLKQASSSSVAEHNFKMKMPPKLTMESPEPIRRYNLMDKAQLPLSSQYLPPESPVLINQTSNAFSIRNGLTMSLTGNNIRLEHVFSHNSKFLDSNQSPVSRHKYGALQSKIKQQEPNIKIEEPNFDHILGKKETMSVKSIQSESRGNLQAQNHYKYQQRQERHSNQAIPIQRIVRQASSIGKGM